MKTLFPSIIAISVTTATPRTLINEMISWVNPSDNLHITYTDFIPETSGGRARNSDGFVCYCPQTKCGKDNVFARVCHSVHGCRVFPSMKWVGVCIPACNWEKGVCQGGMFTQWVYLGGLPGEGDVCLGGCAHWVSAKVCVCRWVSTWGGLPRGGVCPEGCLLPPPTETATDTSSTHPTGMHPCLH